MLVYAAPYIANYEKHWSKIPGAEKGTVPLAAAKDYFISTLVQVSSVTATTQAALSAPFPSYVPLPVNQSP